MKLSERLWGLFENRIAPFGDGGEGLLPKNAWAFIRHFAAQAKGPFILLLVTGGLSGAVDAALYWSVGWLIDLLDKAGPADLLAAHWRELAALFVLIALVRTLVMIANAVIEQQVIVPPFFQMVRWQSFRRVIEQPYAFYQNDFAGRIATKIMQGGEAVGDFIIAVLQTFWSFLTFLVLAAAILSTLDPAMGLVLAIWAGAYGLVAWRLLPPLRRAGRRNSDERSILNGRLVDGFTNIMAVKLFDTGQREHAYIRDSMAQFLAASRTLTRSITLVRAAVAVLNGLMMAAVLALAIRAYLNGSATSGGVAAALGLVFRLNQMSGYMMFNINGLIRSFATVQDATGTISVTPAIRDAEGAQTLERISGAVAFDRVSFHYGRGGGIMDNLSFAISPGERVALVGPSGAGKTTVVNLLLRLFDVEAGRVLVDGRDIRKLTQASLRSQFGVVAQEAMLMHRSIRDNIAYGRPGASEAEIIEAAKKAQAHDFISEASDPQGRKGYDAHVGERGVKLSGGQRQRIAIARVMLKNAPVLVLDEATSALDSEAEAAIQDNLSRLMEGKTVIAIAHRLSTIAAMDRLIVLDRGQIVEAGRHAALVEQGGLYARLWKRQSGGFLAAQPAENPMPEAERTKAAE